MRRSVMLAAMVSALILAPLAVYAAHSFEDVPASNTFHADIEWLKEAGVTKGCNPPANDEFCPDDFVTRGQMSAFMHRLADLQVVDAGALDGQDPAAYQNPSAHAIEGGPVSNSAPVPLAELSIDTPGPGGLIIDTTIIAGTSAAGQPAPLIFWTQVDNATCSFDESALEQVMFGFLRLGDNIPSTGSVEGAIAVPAGSHTVTACAATGLTSVVAISSVVAEYSTSVTRTVSSLSLDELGLSEMFTP